MPVGNKVQWYTDLPPALNLLSFSFPAEAALLSTSLLNHPDGGSSGFSARFISAGGGTTFIDDGQPCCGGMDYARAGSWTVGGPYFVLDVYCATEATPPNDCAQGTGQSSDLLDIRDFTLTAEDDQAPAVREPSTAPAGGINLWAAHQWVRGTFNLAFVASNDTASGICTTSASIGGRALPSPAGASSTPNTSVWEQCPGSYQWQEPVDTTAYPNGESTLLIASGDAATPQNVGSRAETIGIDNAPVTLSLTGPSDVAASPGTATAQITATATGGPSGTEIFCSVDGGGAVEYGGASATIPISGLGIHHASCYAQNNAIDAAGNRARSATQAFTVKLGTPTIAAVGFSRLVDRLQCRRTTERVRLPGRWVTVIVGDRRVRVHERAHTQRIRVTRCRVRTVRRRVTVWVTIRRHGRTVRVRRRRVIRVLLEPHFVNRSSRVVGYGRGTTVNGWLGTTAGLALGGQTVDVLTAADNGRNNYHVAATATTAVNGSWSVHLGGGPSRLIRASYPGAPTAEAAQSPPVTLVVPARITILRVSPSRVAWGRAVRITGRLFGGYYPPGGALVRLRIGEGSAVTTYGVREHVAGHHGLFTTTYVFGVGDPAYHRRFFFEVATLPMGDYPYAPGRSNRRYVLVGG